MEESRKNIQLVRTIANQLIIGEVQIYGDNVRILKPYDVLPTQAGLQLFPFDAEIIGHELAIAEIDKSNTIYITTAGEALEKSYLKATSDSTIEEPEKPQILI